MRISSTWRRVAAITAIFGFVGAACGSDDASDSDPTATSSDDESTTTAPDAVDGENLEALTVALLIGGPRDDGGFYQAMVDGLEDAAAADGAISVTVIEEIADGGDAALEAAVQNAADSGDFDLIVAHGFDLVPGVARYAPDYPDQPFAASLPVEDAPNVAVYLTAFEETGYNAGFLAAQGLLLSDADGAVGFLGGPGLPFEQQALFGFEQAIEEYAPGTQVVSVFTGTFEDAQLAQESAAQMFRQGVISLWNQQAAGQSGVYQTCAATEGVVCFGNSVYSEAVAPDVVLASTASDYGQLVPAWAERIRADSWGPDTDILDLANGGTTISDATAAGLEQLPGLQEAIEEHRSRSSEISVALLDDAG